MGGLPVMDHNIFGSSLYLSFAVYGYHIPYARDLQPEAKLLTTRVTDLMF